MGLPAKQIKHTYITRKEGVCGGNAVIEGTRISINCIIGYWRKVGYTPEEIVRQLPHLTLAQVYDAISYYYDHKEEIDEEVRLNSDEAYWKRRIKNLKTELRERDAYPAIS